MILHVFRWLGYYVQCHRYACEDVVADFIQLQQSVLPEVVTAQMINTQRVGVAPDPALISAARLHCVVGLADSIASDAAFCRQLRRKLL